MKRTVGLQLLQLLLESQWYHSIFPRLPNPQVSPRTLRPSGMQCNTHQPPWAVIKCWSNVVVENQPVTDVFPIKTLHWVDLPAAPPGRDTSPWIPAKLLASSQGKCKYQSSQCCATAWTSVSADLRCMDQAISYICSMHHKDLWHII